MRSFRELESSSLYAGLGVKLVDDYASVPAAGIEATPPGWSVIELDIDDNGTWRQLDPKTLVVIRTQSGVTWFPWLERYRDATNLPARNYRVRITADALTPRYRATSDGIVIPVSPYDDNSPPAALPSAPLKVSMLPSATYPFAPGVPVLRGLVVDGASVPVADALVSWDDATLQTDAVLTDSDGEFSLPMRRAPVNNVAIVVKAERGALSGDVIARIPQTISTFQIISIS